MELPQSEEPDEALRTKWRSKDRQVPQWLEVADKVMEEQMSEEGQDERVRYWLEPTVLCICVRLSSRD